MASQRRGRQILTAILGGSGVLHFVAPKPYEKIVPPQLGHAKQLVAVSGVLELLCAGLLAAPKTRRLGGLLSAGLLVGVFPANIYSVKLVGENRGAKAAAIARLPLQAPMIRTALRIARESE